jgi:hypothetical protein
VDSSSTTLSNEEAVSVKLRSFTVPKGSRFICTPTDGQGPVIAEAGAQVTIVVSETWDEAAHLITTIRKPEARE